MKLRAWLVFPLASLLLVGTFFVANLLVFRRFQRTARPEGDFLTTMDPPGWYWPLIVAPPLLLIGAYVWQRIRG